MKGEWQIKNVEAFNSALISYLKSKETCVVYGQNVDAGSRIGGIAKQLSALENIQVINSTNTENTLAGFGFGLLLADISSCYILKQHDFMLLGMDHWRNTWNMIKTREFDANYVVFAPVVDSGYEGPQANLNNLAEFSSIFDCPVHLANSSSSINKIFCNLNATSFSIVGLSQKQLKSDIDYLQDLAANESSYSIFVQKDNTDETIEFTDYVICLGYSWCDVLKEVQKSMIDFSRYMFIVPHMVANTKYIDFLKENTRSDMRIVLFDDSYSSLGEAHLHKEEIENQMSIRVKIVKIEIQEQKSRPHSQKFTQVNEFFKNRI